MVKIELLAPARDLACGLAAIDCGADAVYVGAPRFGARAKAGNSLADIEALVRHAHTFWARVYVTVNTLLYDHELPKAVRLIHRLYEIGVDGIIVQDTGLLECDLPPIPLIASTQMHNHTPARVAFLEQVGFQRAILARELSLEQIEAIRRQTTTIELECFVHGALCVCYSGQCTMSYAIGGRSGNRGECAQPCRRCYSLVDRDGRTLVSDRYLLSLRDMNLSAHLADLIDAGISSFKIEGRLKDRAYVVNVVSTYRRQLDEVLQAKGLSKSSSGQSRIDFMPDLAKTFNRGYTTYFLLAGAHGQPAPPGSIDTPKMVGEPVGRVTTITGRSFTLDTDAAIHSGDGLCFFDEHHTLRGTVVNAAHGRTITPDRIEGITPGTPIYRNHDHAFLRQLKKSRAERRIAARFRLEETPEGFRLWATDEDGNTATETLAGAKVKAEKPDQALATARKQLSKTGSTEFACTGVEIAWQEAYFVPVATWNELRRSVLEKLTAARAQNRLVLRRAIHKNDAPYPEKQITYLGNALNRKAEDFYRRHGVAQVEPAAESGLDMRGRQVMRTRYCLRHQLGLCRREESTSALKEPLYLVNEDEQRFELHFDCQNCEMGICFTPEEEPR